MPAAQLEVVMYRGHSENAFSAAHLEIAYLYDHGKSLDHVDEAGYRQEPVSPMNIFAG